MDDVSIIGDRLLQLIQTQKQQLERQQQQMVAAQQQEGGAENLVAKVSNNKQPMIIE